MRKHPRVQGEALGEWKLSFRIRGRLREIVALEKGSAPKDPGGRIRVALLWPGDYRTGMSALGWLSIYGFLNSRPDVLAERFFLPEGALAKEYERGNSRLLSLESARPLAEFDLAAASLSLENDYWLLPRLLTLGGLDHRRDGRGDERQHRYHIQQGDERGRRDGETQQRHSARGRFVDE